MFLYSWLLCFAVAAACCCALATERGAAEIIRGELAKQARIIAPHACIRRIHEILTMMQQCASARSSGAVDPIFITAFEPCGMTGHHHLGSSSAVDNPSVAGFRNSLLSRVRAQAARIATPSGISPVVTIRHSAMRSFRANATIMVLRMAPRASFVATRYHCASALSFWNLRKRQAS